jgi:hypothetical protein
MSRCCALLLLLLLGGCEWPVMSLAERVFDAGPDAQAPVVDAAADADADADADEDLTPCASASDCPNPRDPDDALCDLARGLCVECLGDGDCAVGESCDADGECDD